MTSNVFTPLPQDDKIGGPATTELAGTLIEYTYSTGNRYRMEFGPDTLTFHLLEGSAPPHTVTLPYRARLVRPGLYLVTWTVKPGIHVTLLVDLTERVVHVSAMMPPNQWEFFDIGHLTEVRQPEDPAR
ncbi:MoaF N-terminal domain-containing protein [Streptomyces sp. NPDC051133]|uniref:MoaF-related domain-containing protein n=1 Tax=Streptomyces sp. NPDC051133 TaxID=3155521 RepID=UPI00341C56A4